MMWKMHPSQDQTDSCEMTPVDALAKVLDGQVTLVQERDTMTFKTSSGSFEPRIIVRCETADDAEAAKRFAELYSLPTASLCSDEQLTILKSGSDGMLIDVAALSEWETMLTLGLLPKRLLRQPGRERLQTA